MCRPDDFPPYIDMLDPAVPLENPGKQAHDYSIEDAIMAACPHEHPITLCGDCGAVLREEGIDS